MPALTLEIVMKKINILRSQYRRELKHITVSRKSGAGAEDVYIPTLWCFDMLTFLKDGDDLTPAASTLTLPSVAAATEAELYDQTGIVSIKYLIYAQLLYLDNVPESRRVAQPLGSPSGSDLKKNRI